MSEGPATPPPVELAEAEAEVSAPLGPSPRHHRPSSRGSSDSRGGGGSRWRAGRALRLGVLGLLGVVVALVVAAVAWYEVQVHASAGATTVVSVPSGATVRSVEDTLAREHVVGSSLALRIYFFFHGAPLVRPGGYALHRSEPFGALRADLERGPNVLVVPPGFTVAETAARLGQLPGHSQANVLSLVRTRAVYSRYEQPGTGNLDGLLAPGQYILAPGESDASVLAQMVTRFDQEAERANLDQLASTLGVSPYEAITIASIVQKEGVYPQNLAKVARVVYNRLAHAMALQMDSTVLYAEGRDGGTVTKTDLALDSPYNTYLHKGLPPTPICVPSAASLDAALHPAPGDWLYFVLVQKDGTEAFSNTLAEQLANEQLAQSRGLG